MGLIRQLKPELRPSAYKYYVADYKHEWLNFNKDAKVTPLDKAEMAWIYARLSDDNTVSFDLNLVEEKEYLLRLINFGYIRKYHNNIYGLSDNAIKMFNRLRERAAKLKEGYPIALKKGTVNMMRLVDSPDGKPIKWYKGVYNRVLNYVTNQHVVMAGPKIIPNMHMLPKLDSEKFKPLIAPVPMNDKVRGIIEYIVKHKSYQIEVFPFKQQRVDMFKPGVVWYKACRASDTFPMAEVYHDLLHHYSGRLVVGGVKFCILNYNNINMFVVRSYEMPSNARFKSAVVATVAAMRVSPLEEGE